MTVRTPLWWDGGALYFGSERRDCPEKQVCDLEASLRGALDVGGWSLVVCKDVGQRLWRWLHGEEQWLRPEALLRPTTQPWRLEVGGSLAELVHLPWELLHDEKGFLAARNPAFLPLRRVDDPRPSLPTSSPPRYGMAVLFMAAAPPTQDPLHFEEEERRILGAVPDGGDIRLEVEESGTVAGLTERCGMLEDWSVVHLSCHGRPSPPELALETDEGGEHRASPDDVLTPLHTGMPRLLVVSACSSAEFAASGDARGSLAQRLVAGGCSAVLGFGAKVRDDEAIAFAGELYKSLANATRLDLTVADLRRARAASGTGEPRTWASLRLFTQNEPGLVVAPKAGRTHRPGVRPLDGHAVLSGAGRSMPIAHPMRFVGRRRELQRALRGLRAGPGVLLQGVGGVGKSSIAGRLLSRMTGHRPVTVIGRLDTHTLVRALRDAYLSADDVKAALHDDRVRAVADDPEALVTMIAAALECPVAIDHPALFVFDDAEANLEPDPSRPSELRLRAEAERCYRAVLRALAVPGTPSRALVTTRSALVLAPRSGEALATLHEVPVGAPSAQDQEKLLRRADRYDDAGQPRAGAAKGALGAAPDARRALTLTGANPRLFALVHRVWTEDAARGAALLGEIDAYLQGGAAPADEEVQRHLLVRAFDALLDLAGATAKETLAMLATVEVPVPLAAVRAALTLDAGEGERLVRLGVVERDLDGDLGVPALVRARLPKVTEADAAAVRAAVWRALDARWKVGDGGAWKGTAEQAYFVVQGCVTAKAAPGERERAALRVAVAWLMAGQRSGEARALSELAQRAGVEEELALRLAQAWHTADGTEAARYLALAESAMVGQVASLEGAAVLAAKGDMLARQGKLDGAIEVYRAAQKALEQAEGLAVEVRLHSVAVVEVKIADILMARGHLDEALCVLRQDVSPAFERLRDVRALAVAQGQIADILMDRGDLDEALRIRSEVQIPIYTRLGDVRSLAVTQGQIADILMARGELDEALRIRREEEIPVYTRLGDTLSCAIAQRKVADVLEARGDLDEALRLLRDESLPAAVKVGSIRDAAVFQGRVADILMARGDLDEALRIRREEEISVYTRLGDVRELAVAQGKIADIVMARGDLDEALRIRREEQLLVFERLGDVRELALAQGKIADILVARGDLDEALRTLQQDALPAFERLRDVRSLAVTQGKIADILMARGDLDEALRIRREELLPVYTRLGDVRSLAVTRGQIADILMARGDLDEALRIRREEQLPVFERLGDVVAVLVTRTMIALTLLQMPGLTQERAEEIASLLTTAYRDAVRLRIPEAAQIRGLADRIGLPLPDAPP